MSDLLALASRFVWLALLGLVVLVAGSAIGALHQKAAGQ